MTSIEPTNRIEQRARSQRMRERLKAMQPGGPALVLKTNDPDMPSHTSLYRLFRELGSYTLRSEHDQVMIFRLR